MFTNIRKTISIYLAKYFPDYRLIYILAPFLLLDLYINNFKRTGFYFFISLCAVPLYIFLQKHKKYKFKARETDCRNFCAYYKHSLPDARSYGEVIFSEQYDNHNNFLYTEIIVSVDSHYRVFLGYKDFTKLKIIDIG